MIRYINKFLVKLQYKLGFTKLFSYPTSATIEITNFCNLKCHVCDQQQVSSRKFGMMSFDQYKSIINELGPYLYDIGFSDTGETFINKEAHDIISYTSKKFPKIFSYMDTNGHFVQPINLIASGLKKISFSVDGMTQKTYSKYRVKGQLSTVLNNLEDLVTLKNKLSSDLIIELKFIVMKHNQHELKEVKEYAKRLGVEFRLETFTARAFYNKVYNESETIKMACNYAPNDKKYSIYDTEKSLKTKILHTYRSQNKTPCYVPWGSTEILYNGEVRPCVVDFDSEYKFGNILEDKSFYKVWNSKKAIEFRSYHVNRTFRKKCESCSTCYITNITNTNIALPRLNVTEKHKEVPYNKFI